MECEQDSREGTRERRMKTELIASGAAMTIIAAIAGLGYLFGSGERNTEVNLRTYKNIESMVRHSPSCHKALEKTQESLSDGTISNLEAARIRTSFLKCWDKEHGSPEKSGREQKDEHITYIKQLLKTRPSD